MKYLLIYAKIAPMNVYDFDNTIYDGESCFDLFLFYLRRRPGLLLLLPKVVYAFAKYKRGKVTADDFLTVYAPQVEQMLREIPDVQGDMRAFWDTHEKKIKPFYAELRRPDDLLITAGPDFSVREICRRLSIEHFLASRVDLTTGKIEHFNLRERKIEAFRQAYPDAQIDSVYTDSPENDRFLIELARQAYYVKGSKITRIK